MKHFFAVLLAGLVLFSCSAEESGDISGTLDGGLRVLSVDNGNDNLEFTIYRGDYITFKFLRKGFFDFKVPDLEIDTVITSPNSEKKYVKMKKSGDYSFTLDGRKGIIHIVELEEANYNAISAMEASKLIANVKPFILDVRTPGEFNSGHIPGATLLPVQVLERDLNSIIQYKNEPVFIYCASGNRSTVASRILIDAGFTNIYNLRYGINEWKSKKFPIEK